MLRQPIHRLSRALAIAALLAACDDAIIEPRRDANPSFAILDGARGGNAQFYFLPPMVPAPAYSGTFDAAQSPVVNICELAGSSCGTLVTSFSGDNIKIDLEAEAYIARWKTKGAGLSPTKTYRVEVLLGTSVLGYADVVVVSNGSQIKVVDQNQYVAIINGGVLQIRFRIETAPPPPPPPPGVWQNNDLITYTQADWGDATTAAGGLLSAHFNTLYGVLGYVEVGLSGSTGVSMVFTSAGHVFTYLPSFGTPAPLNANLLNPTSGASGVFGGEVLALRFNIDLSDADFLSGTTNIDIGNLTLCGLTQSGLNGTTVRAFQDVANTALGGGSTPYAIADVNAIAGNINGAFSNGAVSLFAQQHLVNGACPGVVWQFGEVITYGENVWGEPQTDAGQLLVAKFDSLYFSVGGVLELGLSFTMTFQTAQAVLNYLPAAGTPSALNANLVDPTSSASGQFGGEVVALKLNVDFSEAGYTRGASGIPFGDLILCGFTSPSGLNGLSVRQFLGHANSALGGDGAPFTISELNTIAIGLNESFPAGFVQQFAQDHLVNGACP